MENKSIKKNNSSNNSMQSWEDIDKVKWSGLPKKRSITYYLKQRQRLIKAKSLLVLEQIRKRISQQIETSYPRIHPVTDIFNILCNVDTLRVSYAKVKSNKGSLTPGTDINITADTINEQKLYELSTKLKNGTFKWKPVRRILIEKPGKPEKRPLGLPDFDDKIVQGAILLILESIYEPEFEFLNCNYGFRPHKDSNYALEKIQRNASFYQYAIEGDIKGAYDNVNQQKLISIISRRINDKKFLKLIHDGLRCGYLLDFRYFDTLLGTPQGSICSPILFNIYMQEFDKFVLSTLRKQLTTPQEQNPNSQTNSQIKTNPKLTKTETNTEYERLRSQRRKAMDRLTKLDQSNDPWSTISPEFFCDLFLSSQFSRMLTQSHPQMSAYIQKYNEIMNLPPSTDKNELRTKRGNIRIQIKKFALKNLSASQLSILANEYRTKLKNTIQGNKTKLSDTPYKDPTRLDIKITYVRYADDWILFVRGTKDIAEKAKEECAIFLKNHLDLTLSLEKTKITDLYNSKATFLGYEIFYQVNKLQKKVDKPNNPTQRFGALQFHPDTKRLEFRFTQKGYMSKDNHPREVGFLTPLQDHEIINKFNQFMTGIGNYYIRKLSYPSRLNRWFYILYYSCIKTLATKHKKSVREIINSYGYLDLSNPNLNKIKPKATDKRIVSKYTFNNNIQYAVLLNYKELMFILKKLRQKYEQDLYSNQDPDLVAEIDMLRLHKVNFRTAFKGTSFCSICGKQEKSLHNHHIRPLKKKNNQKYRGYRGFDKVIASLGRKQIPVCSVCHSNIHNGKYDGLSLEDLYDIRLVAPEGLIGFRTDDDSPKTTPPQKRKKREMFEINEVNRTYFNPEFKFYLIKNNNES